MWILLVILVILLFPFFRGYMAFRAMRNHAQEAFNRQRQQQQEAERKARRQAQGKTFDKESSEYVDFEEVVDDGQSAQRSAQPEQQQANTSNEQQVSDAEFEEIA